ncbi:MULTISPECIES: DUF742 domain-containing protein [Streptomyces]|uniref:DUF742 domain-containing protein n=2 Tax=Streptomyces TaxID=1883 RepID=A0A9X2LNG0_9ACTN|nr:MULTISPECIES: DUF742 domain-containing protein [Streptomyces]MCQ8772730.1 DUF742 domain-containing protein [Streptomyces telluris]NJP78274.1 DUF742 domain-containing protein [Streptomyces telluris]QLE74398.1 DUF742 domain-containing protein [Streptomyces rectiverticillatus]
MTPPTPRHERGLVRPYVVTDGRAHPTRNTFDLVTLVLAQYDRPLTGLSPEKRRLMELCLGGPLSVAEIAGHLMLPVSVTKVLLGDLVDSGHLITRAPIPSAQLPEAQILQEVLDGLRARL